MNIDDIRKFLVKANKNGYGNESIKPILESDGSHTLVYNDGEFVFHDNYFGGEPFGGREVISFQNKPVWMMVYYGLVVDATMQNEIYGFLKESLLLFTDDQPYRGPSRHEKGDWLYVNNINGEFDNFFGEERVTFKGQKVYGARYDGGVVDR